MDPSLLAINATWIVYTIYCVGLLLQANVNYKLKSAAGMSDVMLVCYLTGYLTQFYHILGGGFPASYYVMLPFAIVIVSILVFQRFYYHSDSKTYYLKYIYFCILLFVIFFTPFFLTQKTFMAPYFGWISASIWFIYQLPQIMKIYVKKSFKGVSFSLFSLTAVAVFLEFISALILDLPKMVLINDIRALLVYGLLALQFVLYKN